MDSGGEGQAQTGVRLRNDRQAGPDEGRGLPGSITGDSGNEDRLASEETPLLGNSSGEASEGSGHDGEGTEWEEDAYLKGLDWWHKPSVYWLLPPFFFFALAFGGIIVPKLNLILSLICREYLVERSTLDPTFVFAPVVLGSDNGQCRNDEVQALAAKFTLFLSVIPGTLSAVMAPKLGSLSDRFGRIKFLQITCLGAFLTEIITILAARYPDSINYRWLLCGAFFEGLCGSFTASMALTHAYAADCTAPPKRAVAFGFFHACLFSGIALGPLLAAVLFKATNSLLPIFYFAITIHTCFIVFVLFAVPESLSKKRQLAAREKFAAEGGSLVWDGYSWLWALKKSNILAPLKILWPTGPGTSGHLRANLILLSAVDTIIFGVAMGAVTVVVYYSGYQFDWDTKDTSLFVSIANASRVSALVIILPLLNYLVRSRRANKQRRESGFAVPERNSGSDSLDLAIIRGALFFEIIGYGGYALVRSGPLFIVSGVMAALGGIGSPTLQSALTKHVPHEKVGQLLGASGLLHALARVIFPAVFNMIYANTVGTFPQTVFVVLTGCFGLAFLLSWLIRPNIYLQDSTTATENPSHIEGDVLVDEEIAGV